MTSSELLTIGSDQIQVFRQSNLKNLYIHVDPPEGIVSVKAPLDVSTSEIAVYLLKKMPEISKAKQRFASQPRQTMRHYISGESHYLWGKPYRLQVVYGAPKASITKSVSKIIMNVPNGTTEDERKHLLTEWYRTELKRALNSAIDRCLRKVPVVADDFRVKNMKTKWGTCNVDKKRIWLNLQLVKKPPECLDYVIIHELVHLLERNHTSRFQSLMEQYCPTWRDAKALLCSYPLDAYEEHIGVTDVD